MTVSKAMCLCKITREWEQIEKRNKPSKGCTLGHPIFRGQGYEGESAKETKKERPEK